MGQVLNDFLGVLRLACSRLTPAKRAKEVIRGEVAKPRKCLPSPLHALLPTILLGAREGPTTWRKRGQANQCSLWNPHSCGPFPMALEGPDSKLTSPACPGHLAAFASKCLRNQFEAAVHSGVKGTYTCSFETALEGMFCTTNSLSNGVYLSPC